MTLRQNSSAQASKFLWLTVDFAQQISTATDNITPQLFLTLMAYPAINQIKRFSANTENLGPDDVADWDPGIFTVQAYRSSLADVLKQISSQLASHLVTSDQTSDQIAITVYIQMGGRHYPINTSLDEKDINATAVDIETMVSQHEEAD
ncbi:MAG: hypothetical protein AAGA83_12410 [Cyanobacteria bacterium P01_F01_bin.116]